MNSIERSTSRNALGVPAFVSAHRRDQGRRSCALRSWRLSLISLALLGEAGGGVGGIPGWGYR